MLEIRHLKKYYGSLPVYEDFSLTVGEGETLAVLGNSGAGKTTLLNIVAGLLPFDGGEIAGLPERVGYIFQSDRLVPHFTVEQNLCLVAEKERVFKALGKAGLKEFAGYYPARLSAGMSRRVAILRAFLYDAPLILMDEPFRNLDLALKVRLMDFYASLARERKNSAIFVTHDVAEAACLADRAVIIGGGKVLLDISVTDRKEAAEKLEAYFLSERQE